MSLKNIILGIAIVILTIFVTVNGISVFYPSLSYDDFCSGVGVLPIDKMNETICPAVCVPLYEIQEGECVYNECGSGCGADGLNTFETEKQCKIAISGKNCYTAYDEAREVRAKKVFYVALPLGILVLVVGGFLFSLEAVGAGLMGGGVGTIVYGAGNYWQYGDDLFRFIMSLLGLGAVIYLAYWFNKKYGKRK